jgi:outer membrane protein assembly factor BamA
MYILTRTFAIALLLAAPLAAQTYSPGSIVIDAPSGVDKSEVLHIANLSPGSLTKDQIEAALGRLADTGMYSDLSYTVNAAALTIKLTPSAAAQLQPVDFANFVWWQPGELEPLVEARVPAYHGKLASAGTLTQQVEDALVALMHDKGIDAKVEARETGMNAGAIIVSLVSPSVVIGKIDLQNGLPALAKKTDGLFATLQGEDFESGVTTKTIRDSVNDLYQNAGYLDVVTSAPTYSVPSGSGGRFTVNLTTSLQPGAQYHLAQVNINATPPVALADLTKASGLKPGDSASPAAQRLAKGEMQMQYVGAGYLDAQANIKATKDSAAHTLSYDVTFVPGDQYHFGSLDTSALSPQQAAAFTKSLHASSSTIVDKSFLSSLRTAALDIHLGLASFSMQRNSANHTVVVTVKPTGARP